MHKHENITHWLIGVPCMVVAVIGINYFFNFGSKWDENVVSLPTFLVEIVKIIIFIIGGFIGILYFIGLVKIFIFSIPDLVSGLREVPAVLRHEITLIKQIWTNKGFGKYRLFGGIGFYLRLRMRVIAYVLAFSFFASTTYFTYEQYRSFEPTHWVEKVYHHSKMRTFRFKKDMPYTVCVHGAKIKYFLVNGYYFCPPKSPFSGQAGVIDINIPLYNTFTVTFPEDTDFAINLHTEMVINDIESKKLEVWENKKEGYEYHYTWFDPRMYNTTKQTPPTDNSKKKKKK